MKTHDEESLVRGLTRECQELRQRVVRAERRMRWVGVLLIAVATVPLLLGAFAADDEIVIRDPANGNVRILIKAAPNAGAWIQVNAPDGSRRIFMGEDTAGVPRVLLFRPDQTVARELSP